MSEEVKKPTSIKPISKFMQDKQIRETFYRIMEENNYNPFREMVEEAKDPETPRHERIRIHATLLPYIAPQLKSVDLEAKVEGGIKVIIQRFGEEIAQAMIEDDNKDEKTLELTDENNLNPENQRVAVGESDAADGYRVRDHAIEGETNPATQGTQLEDNR